MANKRTLRAGTDFGGLEKCPTGFIGIDEITEGGLPRGRPTLVCGGAGCGKTLFGIQFLVKGIVDYGEPGVLISFEEPAEELADNVMSMGFDLRALQRQKKLAVDHVRIERSEIEETGVYDLEGLFVRIAYAVKSVGAKRIVLDTIETLFSGLSNTAILRAELRRLFHWLKDQHLTAVVTGERGDGTLTRHGLEEYISDCVIFLDHRVDDQLSTRRMRIVKYRGSMHGTNEYPFLIQKDGITVLPITSLGLEHKASQERVPTGVARLNEMLGGKGFYRGSTVLVSGTAGTGKTTLASHFIGAACQRGQKCLYLAFEESAAQIIRNMRSVGLDLGRHVRSGLLHFHNSRTTICGLEMHLMIAHQLIEQIKPAIVVIDPVTNLLNTGRAIEVHAMLTRLTDFLKSRAITVLMTTLTSSNNALDQTEVDISSLIDTWILLRDIETSNERNRGLYILKSRGMKHSNQIREFCLSNRGVRLLDTYLGPGGLTGSARVAQEAKDRAAAQVVKAEQVHKRTELAARRRALLSNIAALQAQLAAEDQAVAVAGKDEESLRRQVAANGESLARSRGAAGSNGGRRTR